MTFTDGHVIGAVLDRNGLRPARYGADPRAYLNTGKKFNADASGRVESLVSVKIKWGKTTMTSSCPKSSPALKSPTPRNLCCSPWAFSGLTSR